MALPLTGPLKMSDVNLEMKLTSITRTNLGSTNVRSIAKQSTGPISFSQLRGKSYLISVTKEFLTNGTWTAPPDVTSIPMIYGYGAIGEDGYTEYVQKYDVTIEQLSYSVATNQVTINYAPGGTVYGPMPPTPRFCPDTDQFPYQGYNAYWECYQYDNTSRNVTVPTSFGQAATAFQKTFPGSYGNTPQNNTQFNNVAVVPGTTYQIRVPFGGRIWFMYNTQP